MFDIVDSLWIDHILTSPASHQCVLENLNSKEDWFRYIWVQSDFLVHFPGFTVL